MNNLIVRNDASLSVSFSPDADTLREAALASAALIARVSTPEEQAEAVAAQVELKSVIKWCEDSRKAAKEPVIDYGRKIDGVAKRFREEMDEELTRLMRLCGDYQTLQEAKARAAEAARIKDLNEIERQKQEALAKAESHDEMEKIHEQACEAAAAVPIVQSVRADYQVVSHEWEIIVTDIHLLARVHPNCVKIEPRLSEIKALLNSGVRMSGIKAEKKIKSSVRVPRETSQLIEA
jgi:hypothetical protein